MARPLDRSHTIGRRLVRVNWLLLGLVVLITGVGVSTLYSVADGSFSPWADKHTLRLLIGIGLILAMAVVPLRAWMALAYPSYLVALALLALVPILGADAMGARRWLRFGELSLQPSEVMKVALVAALARYYQWLAPGKVSRPLWVLLPVAAIAAPVVMVLRQPDLGTAVLFACVGLGLMFLAGVNILYFGAGAASAVALAPVIWRYLHDYQRRRILTFLDPERDPLGAGYHILQSKIAFGSGGLVGKGYQQGTQGRLNFLPEKQTDFIFTMLAEESGFIGAMVLIGLYIALITMMLVMAMACRNQFSRLIVAGPALAIFNYAAVNMSMVMGLVPVVGVPLPLVSFGGTAMMTILIALGLAMSGYVHRHERIRREDVGSVV
jgi:rod shape determining protein RodA